MSDRDLSHRLEVARQVARQAGQLVMRYYATGVPVQRKLDDSPVTVADREAELLLRREIEAAFPADAILGEEHAAKPGTSAYRWILDPIDGTKSFIAGVPLFGTLIGVQRDEECVLGVIELPGLDRRIHAVVGQGAWHQAGDAPPQRARVSDCTRLKDAVYLTSETRLFGERGAQAVHDQLEMACWYARTWGDCFGYYQVATGRATVMIDAVVNLWDEAPLGPILREAGGSYTDWSGQVALGAGEGLATNGHVLQQVLAITRPYARSG